MSPTWDDGERPVWPRITALGWGRVALKGLVIALTVFGLLPFVIVLRALDARRTAQGIVTFASRVTLRIIGLRLKLSGQVHPDTQAFVANHSTWLDIFVLTAAHPLNFVSKAEVAGWPGIGWVARGTGTVFIARRRTEAVEHRDKMAARLAAGDKLLFFPEGTSTDGQRVLSFRPTLFASVLREAFVGRTIQPISVKYHAPEGADPRLYAWWGDMDFAPHFLLMLALPRHGQVHVRFGEPLQPADFADRKALSAAAENAVRAGFEGFRNVR